jgi:glutamate racemase
VTDSRPIGIFDSGIGGLTVAAEVRRQLPNESFIYLGDTARLPYGPKSPETVRRYAREILDWLLPQSVKAVVVACNTVTAHAIDDLRLAAGQTPVIGVIEPGSRAAADATSNGRVGVIGTAGTIASGAYRRALLARQSDLQVSEQACPLLVPFVEEGWFTHPAARLVAEEYLAPLRAAQVDTLVLGCTHYPLLKPLIADVMGSDVVLIDSAQETAAELGRVLRDLGIDARPGSAPTFRWGATDDVARFRRVSELFLGYPPEDVELVSLATS